MRQLTSTAALYAALVGSVVVFAQESRPSSRPSAGQPVWPPAVELSLGKKEYIETESRVGGDEFRLVSAPNKTLWLILTSSQRLLWTVRRGGVWDVLKPIPITGWTFINRITAVADGGGNPVIVWSGFDGVPGEAVATLRWTGSAWSEPRILDRLETCTSVLHLDSLRDGRGNVHIAYDRPLKPRESYNIGFIFGEGFFPSKCWHAVYDGQSWRKPRPTTGKGRFDLDALGLSHGPKDSVTLALRVGPARKQSYVGAQTWDGDAWGAIEKLKEGEDGVVVASPWGDRLVWWNQGFICGGSVIRGDRESPVAWEYWGAPVPAANDHAGRIAVWLPRGGLRIWNGQRWSHPLQCGSATELIATLDGNLLAGDWRGDRIHIQQILVKELPGAEQSAQPVAALFVEARSSRVPSIREAVNSRDPSRVREILGKYPALARERDYYGHTPLLLATKNGDLPMVGLLLEHGADPDRPDFADTTPLHVAAKQGLLDIAALLLDHGASVNPEDKRGNTPLAYAQAAANEKIVALLKSHGGMPKDYEWRLVLAVEAGDQERVKQLLDQGLSPETAVPNGRCLLDFAAESGRVEMAKLLVARGASVRREGNCGRAPLHWAGYGAKTEMVKYLVGAGADPNATDWYGMTPLHAAVDRSQWHEDDALDIVKQLIACGAQVNVKNNNGVTPLAHAKKYGTDSIRDHLRSCGATE